MVTSSNPTGKEIPQLEPSEAARLRENGSILLDVRTNEEFIAGHIDDVVFITLSEIEARAQELDPEIPLIALCRAGGRSQAAAELLAARGFTVSNMSGGMQAWEAAGLDLVTSDGGPGEVI